MPIYEYACPQCRVIFNFLSKRVQPNRSPVCPRCGNKKMVKEISSFAMLRSSRRHGENDSSPLESEDNLPDLDNPKITRAMQELERDMGQMDENNPRHMAHLMRKMKELLPPGAAPRELETAIRRLESGEDPEKIEEDMGDLLGQFLGEDQGGGTGGGFTHDPGLYDY